MPELLYSENGTLRIGVSKALEYVLRNDAERFEVVRGKTQKTDINKFLNKLVYHYYDQYKREMIDKANRYRSVLSQYIPEQKDLDAAVEQIVGADALENKTAGKADGKVIVFRPSAEYVWFVREILEDLNRQNRSYSGAFRDLLNSYSRKPSYERERIIYADIAEKLKAACDKRRNGITLVYRDKPREKHIVMPYQLVYGSDGLFNYLLCQEYSERLNRFVAVSYRMGRIMHVSDSSYSQPFDPLVEKYLEKMIRYGPQYNINEDIETIVELTEKGRSDFRRIYQGRPIPDNIEDPDDEGNTKMHFNCSQDQLYFYFRRFNPGEARIIAPEALRNKLKCFHEDHLKTME